MKSGRALVVASLTAWFGTSAAVAYVYSDYTWLTYNDHEYTITFTTDEWDEAQAEAVAVGGNLVTINDMEENNWLYTDLAPFFAVEHGLLGFTDREIEGHWEWVSGEGGWWEKDNPGSTSFSYWSPDEPNNLNQGHPGGEDYGEIRLADLHMGHWNDLGFNANSYHGIIEIPEPTTILLFAFGSLLATKRRQ